LCSSKLAWKERKMPPSPSWMTSMSSKSECCALTSPLGCDCPAYHHLIFAFSEHYRRSTSICAGFLR
jgi:hypothetical protein